MYSRVIFRLAIHVKLMTDGQIESYFFHIFSYKREAREIKKIQYIHVTIFVDLERHIFTADLRTSSLRDLKVFYTLPTLSTLVLYNINDAGLGWAGLHDSTSCDRTRRTVEVRRNVPCIMRLGALPHDQAFFSHPHSARQTTLLLSTTYSYNY